MNVVVPCDAVETQKATEHALLSLLGPCYLRFAREATPVVTTAETPYEFGVANVIRYRGPQPRFLDAFDTILGPRYHNEREQIAIIACGPMVPEAMRAAWIMKEEYGIETRIVNVHTVKPLDIATIVRAAEETRVVITAEEHQVGGFGNIIAGAILQHRTNFRQPLQWSMVGVEDRFGVSGNPWELVQHFGLTAEHIAKRALELLDKKVASVPAIGGELSFDSLLALWHERADQRICQGTASSHGRTLCGLRLSILGTLRGLPHRVGESERHHQLRLPGVPCQARFAVDSQTFSKISMSQCRCANLRFARVSLGAWRT